MCAEKTRCRSIVELSANRDPVSGGEAGVRTTDRQYLNAQNDQASPGGSVGGEIMRGRPDDDGKDRTCSVERGEYAVRPNEHRGTRQRHAAMISMHGT